jgi:hypothetical protein
VRTLALLLLTSAVSAQDFEKDVLPLLRTRCFQCHSAEARRPKAGLRLDGREFILAGSRKGAVLVPGDAKKSALYWRTSLPEDHEDVMPPDGDVLNKRQLAVLEKWIAGGAKFGTWRGASDAAKPTKPTKKEAKPSHVEPPERLKQFARLAKDAPVPPEKGLADARAAGARIEVVYGNLLRVEFVTEPDKVTDKQVQALMPLRRNIAILSLRNTKISDRALATIAKMTVLVQLDVPNTAIADKGIANLIKAKPAHLLSLNLYGTAVTDAALEPLAGLLQLKALYLWNSKVTKAGVARLRAVLPTCRVHFERELPKPQERRQDDGNNRRRRKK